MLPQKTKEDPAMATGKALKRRTLLRSTLLGAGASVMLARHGRA